MKIIHWCPDGLIIEYKYKRKSRCICHSFIGNVKYHEKGLYDVLFEIKEREEKIKERDGE